jgi:hypothetical protein
MAIGQAAGTAAAMAAKLDVSPHKLDPVALRKRLKKQGALVG